METLRFEYKLNVWIYGLYALLFTAGTVMLVYMTTISTDPRVGLNHRSDYVLAWTMVICSTIITLFLLRLTKRALGPKRYVVLDEHSISAPKRPSSKTIETIQLSEVTNLMVYNIRSTHFIAIRHNHGQLTISGNLLGKRSNFEKLVETLQKRSSVQQT